MTNEYILARIKAIQQDLEEIKNHIAAPKHRIKLKGLWKGISVSEEEIKDAKRAIFRNAYKFKK